MSFAVGVGVGMFLSQNYDVPDMKAVISDAKERLESLEKEKRK